MCRRADVGSALCRRSTGVPSAPSWRRRAGASASRRGADVRVAATTGTVGPPPPEAARAGGGRWTPALATSAFATPSRASSAATRPLAGLHQAVPTHFSFTPPSADLDATKVMHAHDGRWPCVENACPLAGCVLRMPACSCVVRSERLPAHVSCARNAALPRAPLHVGVPGSRRRRLQCASPTLNTLGDLAEWSAISNIDADSADQSGARTHTPTTVARLHRHLKPTLSTLSPNHALRPPLPRRAVILR